jgi:hypothetical protein
MCEVGVRARFLQNGGDGNASVLHNSAEQEARRTALADQFPQPIDHGRNRGRGTFHETPGCGGIGSKHGLVRLERHRGAKIGGAALYNSDHPEQALANIATIQSNAIFLLKDFSRYCDNDRISRKLRDLADGFRTSRRSIFLLAAGIQLPKELVVDAAQFQLALPNAAQLIPGVKRVLAEVNRDPGVAISLAAMGMTQAAKNLVGLPEDEALRPFRKSLLAKGRRAETEVLNDILDAKRTALRSAGSLETVKRDPSFSGVAGLTHLREWISQRKSAWTPEGQKFGRVPPKGVLITGVQGCGKAWRPKRLPASGTMIWFACTRVLFMKNT